MIKIGRPNLLEAGIATATGLVALLSCLALFRAPAETMRVRDLKVQATNISTGARSSRGTSIGEPVCRISPTRAAEAAKIRLLKAAELLGGSITDLSIGQPAPAAGGLVASLPVTFHLAVSTAGFSAFVEAMSHSKSGLFLDDVDLTPAGQNALDVNIEGRVICDAQAAG